MPIVRPTQEREIILLIGPLLLITVAGPIRLRLTTATAATPRHAPTVPLRAAIRRRITLLRTTRLRAVRVGAVAPTAAAAEVPTVVAVVATAEAAIAD